jgi:hypothetical protein
VGESQLNDTVENFVTIPLIMRALIGIYMIANSVAPFLNLNSITFKVVFTISAGIPSLALFFMQKLNKQTKLEQTSKEKPR